MNGQDIGYFIISIGAIVCGLKLCKEEEKRNKAIYKMKLRTWVIFTIFELFLCVSQIKSVSVLLPRSIIEFRNLTSIYMFFFNCFMIVVILLDKYLRNIVEKIFFFLERIIFITMGTLLTLGISCFVLILITKDGIQNETDSYFMKMIYVEEVQAGTINRYSSLEEEIKRIESIEDDEERMEEKEKAEIAVAKEVVYAIASKLFFIGNCIILIITYWIVKRKRMKNKCETEEWIKPSKKRQYLLLTIAILLLNVVLYCRSLVYAFILNFYPEFEVAFWDHFFVSIISSWLLALSVITVLDVYLESDEKDSDRRKALITFEFIDGKYVVSDIEVKEQTSEQTAARVKIKKK